MTEWLRRIGQPLLRLTTVQKVDHTSVFEEFAQIVERAALEERVRNEPRVVCFRQRRRL
ncbi:hypothetical protein [Acuticoccus sp.]|uniref:hypothetical protein n=1 Tax=Acuticoccus sp. TaxID=1904378 RepID=UPI003B52B8BD